MDLWKAATMRASECAFTMSSNAGRTRAVTASPGLAPCGANEYGPPSRVAPRHSPRNWTKSTRRPYGPTLGLRAVR